MQITGYATIMSLLLLASCNDKSDTSVEAQKSASLASHAFSAKNYAQAELLLSEATKLRPDVPEYWTGLGMAEAIQGKKNKAVRSYEKALELLKNEDQQRYLDQAMLLAYLGRKEEAEETFEKHKADDDTHGLSISIILNDETKPFRVK